MDHRERSTADRQHTPRRKLQVARETLRRLSVGALRNVAGGTWYSADACSMRDCVTATCVNSETCLEETITCYTNVGYTCETCETCETVCYPATEVDCTTG